MAKDERIDWIDDEDRVLGQVTRAQMRAENLLHRVIAVLCTNSAGLIYVHRRTHHKDVFPNLYDTFVAGAVSAGESYDDAALREIGEELGIVGPRPEFLFRHRYDGADSRSITQVYRVQWDGAIRHQASEIAWGAYHSLDQIVRNPEAWRFVPDGWEIFQRYLRERVPGPGLR